MVRKTKLTSVTQKQKQKKSPSKCKFISVGLLIGLLIGAAVILGVYFGLPPRGSSNDNTEEGGGSSSTVLPRHGIFGNAAVAADAGICSTMGKRILEKKGSVVDAYITTALCVGVVQSHRWAEILLYSNTRLDFNKFFTAFYHFVK